MNAAADSTAPRDGDVKQLIAFSQSKTIYYHDFYD